MSKIIYKYTLDSKVLNKVALPKGAVVKSCLLQNGSDLVMYALVDTLYELKDVENRYFKVYSTGEIIEENIKSFVGTFMVDNYLVFHLYEINNDIDIESDSKVIDDKKEIISECIVSYDGIIYPVFKLEDGMYTSGYLKYFHNLKGKKVKVTVEVIK
jgi:hypothetical protein